jgi:hypothetical protein
MSHRSYPVAVLCLLILAACGRPDPSPAGDVVETATPHLTVEELRARALESEAEADRLLAELNGSKATGEGLSGTLAAGDAQRKSGQYFDTVSFKGEPGQTVEITYDTKGYQGVLIVVDANDKVESQTEGPPPDAAGASQVVVRTIVDRAGTGRVLLSTSAKDATGSYQLHISKVTEPAP